MRVGSDAFREYSVSFLEILVSNLFVMGRRKMLSKVIGWVQVALSPVYMELFLLNKILDPAILHIKGFRAFHTDLSSEYIGGC